MSKGAARTRSPWNRSAAAAILVFFISVWAWSSCDDLLSDKKVTAEKWFQAALKEGKFKSPEVPQLQYAPERNLQRLERLAKNPIPVFADDVFRLLIFELTRMKTISAEPHQTLEVIYTLSDRAVVLMKTKLEQAGIKAILHHREEGSTFLELLPDAASLNPMARLFGKTIARFPGIRFAYDPAKLCLHDSRAGYSSQEATYYLGPEELGAENPSSRASLHEISHAVRDIKEKTGRDATLQGSLTPLPGNQLAPVRGFDLNSDHHSLDEPKTYYTTALKDRNAILRVKKSGSQVPQNLIDEFKSHIEAGRACALRNEIAGKKALVAIEASSENIAFNYDPITQRLDFRIFEPSRFQALYVYDAPIMGVTPPTASRPKTLNKWIDFVKAKVTQHIRESHRYGKALTKLGSSF